jgi:16S rRNA A1518/A1519 N6-dimethyltransferase RsmA/KsgA/DIM1 with predicted DNA glycosylase/AP lyase activity
MQKEVADRILARDGKHCVLSLSCQFIADITKICDINPNNFIPVPKVWSTCLQFTIKPFHDREIHDKLLRLIQQGFAQKRKKLVTNLVQAGYKKEHTVSVFESIGLSPDIRAEDLSMQAWHNLVQALFL